MKSDRPKTIERECEGCGKKFEARRKSSFGYTSFCKECVKKKIWQEKKRIL